MSETVLALRARDGSVRAHTTIDTADLPLVAPYRWYLTPTGYAGCNLYTPGPPRSWYRLLLHRVVMGLERGDGIQVDHIDGDPLNNRKANLRFATGALNAQNRAPWTWSGASQYRNVRRYGRRWQASVTVGGATHHLGTFNSEEDAAAVAAEFRRQHMPFAVETKHKAPATLTRPGATSQRSAVSDERHTR